MAQTVNRYLFLYSCLFYCSCKYLLYTSFAVLFSSCPFKNIFLFLGYLFALSLARHIGDTARFGFVVKIAYKAESPGVHLVK
uniref:Uncharacterized protein n=1 Tax=Aeromonas hydrophila TaxID=644 RepID=A0A7G1L1G7_AERHY|nr:hypothetical protein [Aeromonas hydrophila]